MPTEKEQDQTLPMDEQEEAQAAPDETELQPETGADGAESGEEEIDEMAEAQREQWRLQVPELADAFDDLTPEARETVRKWRLAAQQGVEAQGGGGDRGPAAQSGAETPTPPVPGPPRLDVDSLKRRLSAEFGEDGASAVMEAITPTIEYANNVVGLMGPVLVELEERLKGLERGLSETKLPLELRQLVAQTPGAQESDVAEAGRLLRDGKITDPRLALQFVVSVRQARAKGSSKPSPAEAARRRKRAMQLSAEAGSTRKAGSAPVRIPATDQELADLMRREAEAMEG